LGKFTIRIYSTSLFSATQINNSSFFKIQGSWNESTSGGAINFNKWRCNPQYLIKTIGNEKTIDIILQQHHNNNIAHIGLYIFKGDNETRKKIVIPDQDKIITKI